jgi:preprotein translocase subunit SecA
MATEHARVVMVMQGEPDRELLELTYGPEGLTAVKMTMVTLHGLSEEQHVRLAASAGALKERRLVRSVAEFGKIGRNEQCPCGSGKKFKRCCMPAA